MATPERLRMLVFDLARGTWGDEGAEALMELLPPVGWLEVARQSDLVTLRGEMAELRAELRGEMAELRGEMAELRGEIGELRGRVDSLFGKMLVGQVATAAALGGFLATAANLF